MNKLVENQAVKSVAVEILRSGYKVIEFNHNVNASDLDVFNQGSEVLRSNGLSADPKNTYVERMHNMKWLGYVEDNEFFTCDM